MVAAEEAAFVERAAEDEMTVFGIDLAVVELTGLGVEEFTPDELVVFRIVLHAADEDEPDEGSVMVVSRTFIADEVRGAHEHLRDLTVIQSVGTAIDGHDGIAVAGLIINGLPVTEDLVDFRGGEKGDREEADR